MRHAPTAAPGPDVPAVGRPVRFGAVLTAELDLLRPPADQPAVGETTDAAAVRRAADAGLTALCLSGGGIRSASFSIGVLQAFARLGILHRFDYLSTVSGGGYAGAWLSAWRLHAGAGRQSGVYAALGGADATIAKPEPEPLTQVRRLCRYLDPRVGLLSTDVWTLAVTIGRNLLLNWLVLLPLLSAALLVPRAYLGILDLPSQAELLAPGRLQRLDTALWVGGLAGLVAAMTYIALDLPSLGNRRWSQRRFLACFLAPVCLTQATLSISSAWQWITTCQHRPLASVAGAAAAALVAPGLAGLALGRRHWSAWTWIGAATAGALGGAALWYVKARYLMSATALAVGAPGCADALSVTSAILPAYAALDLPLALAILVLEITLLVGISGRAMTDDDREWWARTMAWLLVVATVWFVAGGVVLSAHALVERALRTVTGISLSTVGGKMLLALATLGTGGIATRSGRAAGGRTAPRRLPAAAYALAAPAFTLLLLLLASSLNLTMLEAIEGLRLVHGEHEHPVGGGLVEVLLLMAVLAAVGIVAGRRVSVNVFSLHGMYRTRLVRTFVGASRPAIARRPNPFTGFDPDDDFPVAALEALGAPFHVINCTLNLVEGSGRGGQERKGAAFTITPQHAGSREVGYRRAARYAEGLSLGNAITISGAAVTPQMGDRSSSLLTFLLTLFNARLGVWLGNPGAAGARTWARRDPGLGPWRLLAEMFGRTSAADPYVYLSDGGHFDNLGLYEMIARRCRTIVVSDSGCDGAYTFADLGNAIRRVRIDFGVPIVFPDGLPFSAAGQGRGNAHAAVGRILYSASDPAVDDGVLVYLKATLSGDEPVDVLNYASAHPAFPHESTSNQWFAEAQFESYRALGAHTVEAVAKGLDAREGLEGFRTSAERYAAESSPSSLRADTRSPVSSPSLNLL
jgi:hypothetical protein